MVFLLPNFNCYSDHFAEFYDTKYGPNKDTILKLIKEYPEGKFILNYRNLTDYIHSLFNHISVSSVTDKLWTFETDSLTVIDRIKNTHKCNMDIIKIFKENNIMDKLLVINICNGHNQKNGNILKIFLNINNNIMLTNFHHKYKTQKKHSKILFENGKKKYKHILEDCLKNIDITDQEYQSYLDDIYTKY